MSTPEEFANGFKTLGVKLNAEKHAQLTFIAGLRTGKGGITDEIQIAIDEHIARAKTDPELASRAAQARADIEREAAARQQAIAALFNTADPASGPRPRRTPKGSENPPGT
ncbi:hypothetical protein [Mycobacteroides abscessus]|uniref:hypothetical protein n=1 Tax=Mycobacteroides abscessus TaxID=36809 RepID=UPI000C263CE5|nr:hypothetical protein [Mycobacteroides abscessus]